ncbi:MAG: hypothetical protein M3O70_02585 [Actinomycetota bacterium]|nr:hypothetical protein [Actinomycetota bacterium]
MIIDRITPYKWWFALAIGAIVMGGIFAFYQWEESKYRHAQQATYAACMEARDQVTTIQRTGQLPGHAELDEAVAQARKGLSPEVADGLTATRNARTPQDALAEGRNVLITCERSERFQDYR